MKKVMAWLKKPGLFSKFVVILCLCYSVRIIEWGMRVFESTQTESPTLITVGLGFFGGELLFLCLKRVFAKQDKITSQEPVRPFVQDEFNGQSKEDY